MEKNRYEIVRKNIPSVELVSLTGHTWYDSDHNEFPWTGTSVDYDVYIGPNVNDIVYNVSGGTVTEGYYKWSGSIWNSISNTDAYDDFNIPIFLESSVDELGVMVGFNGEMEQVEQLCNFTYSGATSGLTVNVYNSVYTEKLRTIIEQNFTIDWGDGTPTQTIGSIDFSTLSHTYTSGGTYEVSIYLESPWTNQKLTKPIIVPIGDPTIIDNQFGTFTGYTLTGGTFSQDYLTDLDYNTTGTTYPPGYSGFTYVAFGESKLDQKKLYGSTGYTSDVIITTGYTQYVIDTFTYRDYPDGYTMITGTTTGSTITKEEVPNYCVTRNEHFIGFVDEPTIYSDIFVERGKQGVMEKNLRLCEIDNVGEIELYGNGYFNVIKQ